MTTLAALVLLAQPVILKEHPDESAKFFDPATAVPTIRIKVDEENLKQLRKQDNMNAPHTYVHATLRLNDEPAKEVGLHLKGAAGSFRVWDDKPAITINSNKYVKGQHIHGLDKFHLNNSVQDPFYLNEIVTCELFRKSGVPAARGTHAIVELNGRKVGLYVLKEGYDKTFLARHFRDVNGNLYDGGFLQDVNGQLHLDKGPGCEWRDLRDLVKAANVERPQRIDSLAQKLDMDKFFAIWAVEVMTCDWDGYTRNRNNYRVYHDPASDKIVLFAHGKDQMFQNPRDPLVHGWQGMLAMKLWVLEESRKRYIESMKECLEKYFILDEINQQIDDYSQRLKEPLNQQEDGRGDRYLQQVRQYKRLVKARIDYLNKEVPKLKP